MNAHVTSSGIIDLKKESSSSSAFYVEADLAYYNRDSNSSSYNSSSDTVKMMVSLTTDQTIVATNCLNFRNYDCSKYNCNLYSWQQSIDFPYFSAQTIPADGYIFLDYNNWGLMKTYLYIAKQCYTRYDSSFISSDMYGVLGLGAASTGGKTDFTSSAVFSVSIEPDLTRGKLVFKKDPATYAQASEPIYRINSNSTWQTIFSGGSIGLPNYSVSIMSGNMMFDINSDAIGLPYDVYVLFMKYFNMTSGVQCGSDQYRPICSFNGKIEDLPNVTLSFSGHSLNIPSKIYATALNEGSSFYLNFKVIGPGFSGKSYVTSPYMDSIILDANFMSYYYTVFDAATGNNIISLYLSKDIQSNNNAWWILLLAAIAVVLAGLCIFCAKKKKRKVINNDSTTIDTPTPDNWAKTPLMTDDGQERDSTTVYHSTKYNQQQPQGLYPGFNDAMYQEQRQQERSDSMNSSGVIQTTGEVQSSQEKERAKQ